MSPPHVSPPHGRHRSTSRARPSDRSRPGLGRRTLTLVVAASVAAVGVTVASLATRSDEASANASEIRRDVAGPLGPISVIGDSVLLGSAIYGPTLADRLVEQGWGPVRMRAGEGYSTGHFPVPSEFRTDHWIAQWRAEGWSTRDVVIHLGANDSGLCSTNPQCAYDSIMHLVEAIGPGHRIWWPQTSRLYTHRNEQDNWNEALVRVASENDDFHTWDWPAELETGAYASHDGTHLSPTAYRLRSEVMAQLITDDLAQAQRVGDDEAPPSALGEPVAYVPIDPIRVADTRQPDPAPLAAGGTLTVDLAEHVPDGSAAVAVNLTATGAAEAGFLTAYSCDGARPEASSVNYEASVDRAAMAVIPVSAGARICVVTSAPGHVLVDLQGAFVDPSAATDAATTATGLDPVEPPRRLADTRADGRADVLEIAAPEGASAVAVNLTAVGDASGGYLTAAPCGESAPDVSNVNFGPGEAVAGTAFVPVGPDGTFCVAVSSPADVIVDITGTFAGDGELWFVPATPTRMIDTRHGIGGWAPVQGREQTIDSLVAPGGAAAVTGTLTLATPSRAGFSTAFACGDQPDTSSVNAAAGAAMANGLTTGVSDEGRLCVTTSAPAQTLFDTTGWWVPAPEPEPGPELAVTVAGAMARRAVIGAHPLDASVVLEDAAFAVAATSSSGHAIQAFAGRAHVDTLEPTDPGAVVDRPENVPVEQRVYMVADSVGLGTRGFFQEAFPAGWQAVVDGTPAMFVEQLEARYVRGAPQSLIGDHGVVAGGYNYPYWDPERFDRSIDSIVAAFAERGAKHVYWVTLREVKPEYVSPGAWAQVQPYSWYFPTVNQHLERALERHPNLTLVDWAANADRPDLTYDAIHLNATGANLYSALVRERVDASTQRAPAGAVLRVPIPDSPDLATADTAAVALNLTTTLPRTAGFLTAFPCGDDPPEVSNHNHRRDETLAAAAIVPLPGPDAGPDAGTVCIYTDTDTNVIVDITGRFPADAGLLPVAPRRLADTRATHPGEGQATPPGLGSDQPLRVRVADIPGVPADAKAVALNVTAISTGGPGYLRVHPCDTPVPPTSNVNFVGDWPVPNVVVVEPGPTGEVCVLTSTFAHVIVDLFAAFEAGADLELIDAERTYDSRLGASTVAADTIVEIPIAGGTIPPGAAGVMLNIAAVNPLEPGYLSVFPCAAGVPDSSNLNMVPGHDQAVANFVLVEPDDDGKVCVYTSAATHLLVDTLGWAGDAFVGNAPARLLDTRS